MVNTITLSSDMKTLYLIDDERAIPFDLTSGNGVLIGTLLGQVTVATALVSKDTAGGKGTKMNEKTIELKDSQWTFMYDSVNELFHYIGATNIDFYISSGKEPKCESGAIDIKDKVIMVKRIADKLQLSVVKISSKGV